MFFYADNTLGCAMNNFKKSTELVAAFTRAIKSSDLSLPNAYKLKGSIMKKRISIRDILFLLCSTIHHFLYACYSLIAIKQKAFENLLLKEWLDLMIWKVPDTRKENGIWPMSSLLDCYCTIEGMLICDIIFTVTVCEIDCWSVTGPLNLFSAICTHRVYYT